MSRNDNSSDETDFYEHNFPAAPVAENKKSATKTIVIGAVLHAIAPHEDTFFAAPAVLNLVLGKKSA